MGATPEALVKKKVRDILNKEGAYYVMPVTGGYGNSGAPDFLVSYGGKFVGIECKANKGKVTALQLKNLKSIADTSGQALVINEFNVVQLSQLLKEGVSNYEEANQ